MVSWKWIYHVENFEKENDRIKNSEIKKKKEINKIFVKKKSYIFWKFMNFLINTHGTEKNKPIKDGKIIKTKGARILCSS